MAKLKRIVLTGLDPVAIDSTPGPAVFRFASFSKGGVVPPGCPLTIRKGADRALNWVACADGTNKLVSPTGERVWQFDIAPFASMTFDEALHIAMASKPADGRKKNSCLNRMKPKEPTNPAPVAQKQEFHFGIPMPSGWRTEAEIAAAIEGKDLKEFLRDAILAAIQASKEKKAVKAIHDLIDSSITLDRITEIFNRIKKEQ